MTRPSKYIPLPALVAEFLHRSDNNFPHTWLLHWALFMNEMILYADKNTGVSRKPVKTTDLQFQRQDWIGRPYPVCLQLPDVLERMVAARDIDIDRSPMFPQSDNRYIENHLLRYSRPVLRRKHRPLRLHAGRGELMDKVIAHLCRGEHNEVGMLQWERMILATAEKVGEPIALSYAVLLRPPEPVSAKEKMLSKRILARRVHTLTR